MFSQITNFATYTITEGAVANWQLSGRNCTVSNGNGRIAQLALGLDRASGTRAGWAVRVAWAVVVQAVVLVAWASCGGRCMCSWRPPAVCC